MRPGSAARLTSVLASRDQLFGHIEDHAGLADDGPRLTIVSNRCVARRRNKSAVSTAMPQSFSRRIAERNRLRRINPIVTRVLAECRHSTATIFFALQLFTEF
jgi:hypothetical protein